MKKIMIVLAIIMLFLVNNVKAKEIVIPNEAIRIRVIANSNSDYDQYVKGEVRKDLQLKLGKLLKDAKTIDEVRSILNSNLKDFDFVVEKVLKKNKANLEFDVNYGLNYFPEKEFKGITYESIVVTLGEGKGDNWWCVLFPPLCLMEAEEENISDVEYKSFIKEVLDKFLDK